jgi:methylaspartate mutase epsilon subunit
VIKVKQQRIDDDTFVKMREKELSAWPTGKEVDLDEAIEYHKKMPDSKNFSKVLAKYKEEGGIGLFPRSGVPVVEEEIKLLRSLNEVGVCLFPFTTDSYTRNLQLDKAQKGLEESIKTGQRKLNGYPIINHGVKTTRRVVESCEGAFDPRSSRVANSFVGEIAFASGMTAMPNSFFGWIGGYDKKATVEECIQTAQYLGRLISCYAEKGVIISTDTHGWLPNGVIPMYVNIATQIIEALVSAGQGTKSIVPLMNFQGNINQDIAEIRVCERLFRKYLNKFGFNDVIIPGIIGNQSSLFPFPQDIGNAFGYINYVAMIAAMSSLAACSVKTVDEATGIPSIESHMQTYRSANWIFNVVRQQKFEPVTAEIEQEERMTELAVSAILDKVAEMGDGDVVVGAAKAVEAGVLDSPFSINIYTKDLVLGARDLQGACRYIDYGNLPIPEEVRKYNDEKIREREKAEGIRLSFNTSLADFWALAGGSVIGSPVKKDKADDEAEMIQMKRTPTIVTGTVGVDAHVIGTKIVSKVLKENGFNVVALGAQTPADEFIKVAQETDADAMILSSLYGMAEMDLQGFRDKCIESGIGEIVLYIGGILGVGKRDFKEDEALFKKLGFDRVYPPESDIHKSIKELYKDLKAKGKI